MCDRRQFLRGGNCSRSRCELCGVRAVVFYYFFFLLLKWVKCLSYINFTVVE